MWTWCSEYSRLMGTILTLGRRLCNDLPGRLCATLTGPSRVRVRAHTETAATRHSRPGRLGILLIVAIILVALVGYAAGIT